MEIKTHVLTTAQTLDSDRKERARKNIAAIGSIAVNGETVMPVAGEDSVNLSGYTVPTPSTANKVLTSGEDGTFGWQTPADPKKADKVSGDVNGNLAKLTQDGNLADSGIKATDVATGAKIGPDGEVIPAVGGVIELPKGTAVNDGLLQITVGGTTVEFSANSNNAEPKVVNIQSLEPAQGGTSVSLVTTGEKDSWNKKLDKVTGATQGNFAGLDSNGVLTDSGYTNTDFATAAQGTKADTAYQKPSEGIPYNDLSQGVQHSLDLADTALQSHQDITGKADKVTNATQGNFAGLDSNGNLADSGSKASDFATATQGAKADTAYQKPVDGIPYDDLSQGVQTSLGLADTALQSHQDITGKADKDTNAVVGNLAKFDANGNPVDSDIAASAVALLTDIPSEYLKSATVSEADKKLTIVKQDNTTLDFYGDINKIEKVKVDGQELTIDQADKSVNVVLTGKTDKVTSAVEGNFAGLDSNGNLTDSGSKASDFATAAQGAKADTAYQKPANGIPLNDLSSDVTDIIDGKVAKSEMAITPVAGDDTKKNIQLKSGLSQDVVVSHQDITGKADKVTSAVEGNFAGLDSNGNMTDSGNKASDFATAAQGTKADTAVQTIVLNGTSLSGTSVDLGELKTKQTDVLDPTSSGETDRFIDSISQNANGDITATKKAVQTVIAEGTSGARNGLITKESQAKLDGIASGAQVNVLEGVKVADTELEIVNKKVNIPLATVPSQGVSGTTGVVNLTSNLDSQDPNAAITPSAVAAALRAQAKFFDNQSDWDSFVHDNPTGDAGITYYVQVGSGADQYDVYRWKVSEGAEPGCYKKVDEASISLDGYWHDGPTVSGDGNVVTAITVAATGVPQVTKGLTVGDGTLTMTVGSANAKTFSANQTANETLTIPLASSASGATAATEGLMSSADKEKLDAINDAEYKNKIDTVKVNGSALAIDSADKSVDIPLASYTTGATPTYEDGVVSGQDKKKIDDAIQGVKLEGATDPIVPSNDRIVTIPNAVPTGTGETNGLLTAADKAKLDSFASVNDTTITIDVGGAASGASNPVAGDFTTNQDTAETITIPAAQSAIPAVPAVVDPITGEITTPAQEAVPAQPGVMSAADKDKLDNLKIFKRIQITNNGSTVANIDADDAADTVMFDTGKGMDIMQVGANSDKIQFATTVNNFDRIKVSDGATPTPRVVDVAADDVNQALTLVAGDNITLTPDATNKKITIEASAGNVHFLKAVSDYLADVRAPYSFWILDLEKPNAQSPYGYDYAMASEIIAKLSAGEVFVLATDSRAPSAIEDLFTMCKAVDNSTVGHPAVSINFTRMYAGGPDKMYYTSIYAPSMYDDNAYPEGRMAILNPRGYQDSLCEFEFMPYTDLANVATTGDYNDLNNLPNLALKEDVSNKSQTLDATSTTEYPSSKAAADFVNSSIADNQTTTVRQNGQADNSKCPTEAAVRTAIDSAVSSAYHAAGSKTVAQLTSSLLVSANEGVVYNITDSGSTTSDFIEGAGYPIMVGDNVVVCNVGEGVYKFDLLSGFIDLTNYLTKTGDGSDVTTSFTTASTRTNITTGDKLSVLSGKVSKWFSDLNSLAFKDKVDTADIEDDAVTADKVKDNETLPVNISGYASHLRQARCRFSNNQSGYRLMAYLPPESGYSDTLYVFNIYEARDAAVLDSGVLKGTLSVCIRNNDGSYQYSSSYSGYSLSDIGIHLRVDASTHGVNLYAAKSNSYYSTAIFELLNAYEQNGTEMNPTMYVNSTLLESITGTSITPTVTLLKQSGGTIPLANNSGVGSTTQPVYVDSSGLVQSCNSVIAKNLESSLCNYGTSGSKFRLVAKSAPLGNTVNVHFECRISASNYSLFQSATLLFNAVYSQSDNSITFSNAEVVNDYGSSNLWRFYLVPNVTDHEVEIYAEAIGSSYNSLNLIALFANGEGQNYVNGTTYLHTVVDSVPTPNVVVPDRKVVSIDSAVGSATEPVYVSNAGEVLPCTPSSMSVGTASYAILADTGVKLPTAWGAFDTQTGYRLLATLTAPGAWNDRICTFNVFETRAGMSEPYGQLGTLTVQIRNNNGSCGYGASYCGIPLQNIDIVVKSNNDQSMSIYAYSSGSVYGGLQLALASSSGYIGNPTGREGLTLYLNNSIQDTVTGSAVTIYKTRMWDYVKSKIVEYTVNVNQVDTNTETSSFTFVNGHIYHLTMHLEGSFLTINTSNSGTGYVVAYIGSSMTQSHYSCRQLVDIQSGVITSKDIKFPINWKAENITDSSDNQLHVVVVFNQSKYAFTSVSDYELTLMGTDFSGA